MWQQDGNLLKDVFQFLWVSVCIVTEPSHFRIELAGNWVCSFNKFPVQLEMAYYWSSTLFFLQYNTAKCTYFLVVVGTWDVMSIAYILKKGLHMPSVENLRSWLRQESYFLFQIFLLHFLLPLLN